MSTTRLDSPLPNPAMSEEVDARTGRVRVRGHLTRQGVDLLNGTVESLCRQGHSAVVVDLTAVDAADRGTLDALRRWDGDSRCSVVFVTAP